MSGQIIELIFFAGIAIFIINKLISILGTTSDDDPAKNPSRNGVFGDNMKEVISEVSNPRRDEGIFALKIKKKFNLAGFVVPEREQEVANGLIDLENKLPNFNIEKFIKGSRGAFQMVIENSDNDTELEDLVDRRYIANFKDIAQSYGNFISSVEEVKAQIAEVYTFGNNIFIKVLFTGSNLTEKIKHFHEEWTFTKNVMMEGPGWYLSNIDRPQ